MSNAVSKDSFDAALVEGFRDRVKAYYVGMKSGEAELDAGSEFFDKAGLQLHERDCPLCGTTWHKAKRIFNKFGANITRCLNCEFVFAAQVISEEDEKRLTEKSTGSRLCNQLHEEEIYNSLKKTKCRYILQQIEPRLEGVKTLLDVGCLNGVLLDVAGESGWEAMGVERLEHAVRACLRKGLKVLKCTLPGEAHLLAERFSAVVLLDVLEHVIDPVPFLKSIRPLLRERGVLAIQVPNFDSLIVRLEGKDNWNFCPGHSSYFTRESLERVAFEAGYEMLAMETYITELDRILEFDREKIVGTVRNILGRKAPVPEDISTDWIHDHFLGYKLFCLGRMT